MKLLLYIDDNEDDCGAAMRIFANTDIYLDCAPSVAHGLLALENGHYDLAICDMMMPDKDGLSFAKEISSSDINTPFLLASGVNSLQSFDNYKGLKNYLGFILKPLTPEKIAEFL